MAHKTTREEATFIASRDQILAIFRDNAEVLMSMAHERTLTGLLARFALMETALNLDVKFLDVDNASI